jgi:hypothetical protein
MARLRATPKGLVLDGREHGGTIAAFGAKLTSKPLDLRHRCCPLPIKGRGTLWLSLRLAVPVECFARPRRALRRQMLVT